MIASTKSYDQAVLTDLNAALRNHYGSRLSDLVLIGSRARGDAAKDSDFDVLVVLTGVVDPRQERQAVGDVVYRVCWDHDAVVICHFISASRYASEQSPLFLNARREGVTVPA